LQRVSTMGMTIPFVPTKSALGACPRNPQD
jgi:hypothetical protein